MLHNFWETTPRALRFRFKPTFDRFLAPILSLQCDLEELGQVLLALQNYFQHYDYQKSMNSLEAWNVLKNAVRASWENRPAGTEQAWRK